MSKSGDLQIRDYLGKLWHALRLFLACGGVWCASCFTAQPQDLFKVKMPRDFNGESLAELEDKTRFKRARPGDHLFVHFQCPNCQSPNI
jgi:hypothetical protein